MRKLIYILLTLSIFYGCQEDKDVGFDISISQENISFQPTAGGAIMHYRLPADPNILSIRIRYQDAFGKEILRTGSYACDSLLLVGFNEAKQNVTAFITLCDRNNVESVPLEVSFDTKDSGPVAFFEQLEIRPSWDGFLLTYDVPQNANGMAHVFYIGKDPKTQEPDTLLVKSFQITSGADTLAFPLKEPAPQNTIIVRTEDFRGYMVKQQVWENIEAYSTALLTPSKFDFLDPEELSIEDPEAKLSKSYLFDGDTKGETSFGTDRDTYGTYLAGPDCFGKPLFIIDLREEKLISEVRLYSMLYTKKSFPSGSSGKYGYVWGGQNFTKIPCNVTIYASNDKTDESSWEKLRHFEQSRELDNNLRWCSKSPLINSRDELHTLQEMKAAQPQYISIPFVATGNAYRFIKVVINDTFGQIGGWGSINMNEFVTFHEFEVYTKKD